MVGLNMCVHNRVPPRIGRGMFSRWPLAAVAVNRLDEPFLDNCLRLAIVFFPWVFINQFDYEYEQ